MADRRGGNVEILCRQVEAAGRGDFNKSLDIALRGHRQIFIGQWLTHGGILRGARIKENGEQRGAAVMNSPGKSEKTILICDGLNNLSR